MFSVSLYIIFMCCSLDIFSICQFPLSSLFDLACRLHTCFLPLFKHLFYIVCLMILKFEVFVGSVLWSLVSASYSWSLVSLRMCVFVGFVLFYCDLIFFFFETLSVGILWGLYWGEFSRFCICFCQVCGIITICKART